MAHKNHMVMTVLPMEDYDRMIENQHFDALDAKLREAGLWHGERRAETTDYQNVDCRVVKDGEDIFGRVSGEDQGMKSEHDNPGDEY